MPKTDKTSVRTKGKSKASKKHVVQLPDETQVDDPKGVAAAVIEGTGEAPVEVVSEDPAEGKAPSQTGIAVTETGGSAPSETSKAGENGAERVPILGGKRRAVKVKDKNSRTLYDSKSKAGKALAEEFGLDPNDSFVWYRIVKLSPDRFEEIGG